MFTHAYSYIYYVAKLAQYKQENEKSLLVFAEIMATLVLRNLRKIVQVSEELSAVLDEKEGHFHTLLMGSEAVKV